MESNNFYTNFDDELNFLIDSTVTSEQCYNPNGYSNHGTNQQHSSYNNQHYQEQPLNGQQNHYQYNNDHVNGYHNGYLGQYNCSPTSTTNLHPHQLQNQIQVASHNGSCQNQQSPSSLNQVNYDQQHNNPQSDLYSNYNNPQPQLTDSSGFIGTNNNPLIRSLLTSPKNSSSSSSSPSASSTSSNISTGTTTTSHSSEPTSPYFSNGCPSNGHHDHVPQPQSGSLQFSPDSQTSNFVWSNPTSEYQYSNQSPNGSNGFYGHHHMHHSPQQQQQRQQKIVPVTSNDVHVKIEGSNGLRIIAPGLQVSQQQQQLYHQNSDSRSAVTTTGGLNSSPLSTSSPSSSSHLPSPSSSSTSQPVSSSSFSPNSLSFPSHHHQQQQQQQQLLIKSGVASNGRMIKNGNHNSHHHAHHINGHVHNHKNGNMNSNNNVTTIKVREKKTSKKRRDPNEPQKPVSAYALFFRDTQAVIKGNNPNASFGEVSKIVASMWDQLDPDSKVSYKKRTEQAKREYLQALASYRASLLTAS